jgi:hypothetical protein
VEECNFDPNLVVSFSLMLFCCLHRFPAAREALLLGAARCQAKEARSWGCEILGRSSTRSWDDLPRCLPEEIRAVLTGGEGAAGVSDGSVG